MTHQPNTIPDLFEARAAATPDAIAVSFADEALTYRQLDERANRLAHRLIRHGVTGGAFVGVCLERCPEVIVGLLGVLKAGGAYAPLDPAYPDERLAFMLGDTAARVVLAHRLTIGRLTPLAGRTAILALDADTDFAEESPARPARELAGDDLAYVMYTSGSTGQPKGVLVRQRGVTRLVRGADYCAFGPDEVFLLHSPLTFDATTFEIWGPLLNGGRLAVLPPGPPAPDVLADAIRRHGVTTLWLTAGLFHLMVEQRPEALAGVRQLVAGGDVLSPAHVRRALDARGAGVLVNGYGPTETTTFACCFRMTPGFDPAGGVPIGKPIAATTIRILDEQTRPVAPGEPGELYIGGDGVAAGYLNRPELTRERFVPDPLDPAATLYRTGDRVRLRPDGNVEFLGRLDGQVKIAGHRIEPEEVEAALHQHPAVRQAVVTARALPSGEKQLVAYVVADSATFSPGELKRNLESRLPRHLVPAQVVRLDRLPLTLNGKVDRAALPPPEHAPTPTAAPAVAEGRDGELAAIWARVLGRPVGPEDNFFDLGGTSLQLLEVHALLTRSLGRDVPLVALFEYPTVRSLARHLFATAEVDSAVAATRDRARRQQEALLRRRRSP